MRASLYLAILKERINAANVPREFTQIEVISGLFNSKKFNEKVSLKSRPLCLETNSVDLDIFSS